MCYDISYTVSIKKIADYFPDLVFDAQFTIDFEKGSHIAGHAYGEHAVIYKNKDGLLHCDLMEWGCIPYYIKEEAAFIKQRASMLNARSERVLADNKSYWYKVRNRRCLVPVSGFYEHREIKGVKNKIPYFISLPDQPLFFLPGLYSVAELPDKQTGELHKRFTFAILTRNANSVMQQIHNSGNNSGRMPLMLPFALSEKWVRDELSDEEYKAILAYEIPSDLLEHKTVFTIRGPKIRPDNKSKNEFFQWENVPELCI